MSISLNQGTGAISTTCSTISTSTSTGSIVTSGGMGVAGILNTGNGKANFFSPATQVIHTNSETPIQYNASTTFNTFGSNLTISNSNSKFLNASTGTMYLLVVSNISLTTASQFQGIVRVNGGTPYTSAISSTGAQVISAIVSLNNNDYVEVRLYQNTAGDVTISSNTNLSLYQLP